MMTFKPARLPFKDLQLTDDEVDLWLLEIDQLPSPSVAGAEQSSSSVRFIQRFYLRLLLAGYLTRPAHQVKLIKTVSGKPYIQPLDGTDQPPLYFSLSHHQGYLLIAICRSFPVGVDLESETRRLRQPMELAKRYFHPSECHYLDNLPTDERHENWLKMWTCKEAVVKATGGGIVSGLDRFAVLPGEGQPQLTAAINTPMDDVLQKLKLVQLKPKPGMLGALACAQTIKNLRGWHLSG